MKKHIEAQTLSVLPHFAYFCIANIITAFFQSKHEVGLTTYLSGTTTQTCKVFPGKLGGLTLAFPNYFEQKPIVALQVKVLD